MIATLLDKGYSTRDDNGRWRVFLTPSEYWHPLPTHSFLRPADAKGASVATATRYDSVACDDGRFISLMERALALLTLVSPRSCDISLAHPLFGTFSFSSSCLQLVEIKEMEYYHFRAGWPDRLPATTALHRCKSVLWHTEDKTKENEYGILR